MIFVAFSVIFVLGLVIVVRFPCDFCDVLMIFAVFLVIFDTFLVICVVFLVVLGVI